MDKFKLFAVFIISGIIWILILCWGNHNPQNKTKYIDDKKNGVTWIVVDGDTCGTVQ